LVRGENRDCEFVQQNQWNQKIIMKIKIDPVKITGCGDSLWGESAGEFIVDQMLFNNFCGNDEVPYELQLFGKNTKWQHYTDNQIEEEVNKYFLPIVQKQYPIFSVIQIIWSEQGMQPDNGWSFDIIVEEEICDYVD
jgi:hypothetical protein